MIEKIERSSENPIGYFVRQEREIQKEPDQAEAIITVDDKYRIMIPASFINRKGNELINRKENKVMILGTAEIISPAVPDCELFRICTLKHWRDLDSQAQKQSREFQRIFYAHVSQSGIDEQQRILIPERIRSVFNLKPREKLKITEKEEGLFVYRVNPNEGSL